MILLSSCVQYIGTRDILLGRDEPWLYTIDLDFMLAEAFLGYMIRIRIMFRVHFLVLLDYLAPIVAVLD